MNNILNRIRTKAVFLVPLPIMIVLYTLRLKNLQSCFCFKSGTGNPLYTDTRYNDEIPYNDNLTVTKPLLKR